MDNLGGSMKRFLLGFVGIILMANICFAMGEEERHTFFNRYNPSSSSFVYYDVKADAGLDEQDATGDQMVVNTYKQKTIQISGIMVNDYIIVRVEGRVKDQTNTPNWAVLDTVEFGSASADSSINQIIDVSEYVDILRVGIRKSGTNGTSYIDVRGIFTTLER
jgi:hypothetical protein